VGRVVLRLGLHWDTATVTDLEALRLGPLTDVGAVADGTGFQFADPTTGREIWLSDVL
jgi:hypothetical protein